ncbi:hypothetical protein CSC75_07260 [Pseudoxanthomonas wuyuanensis]|nr:hypothetical protein CSC75_07260 [Pseudoxanthomonas wuyuanensis]
MDIADMARIDERAISCARRLRQCIDRVHAATLVPDREPCRPQADVFSNGACMDVRMPCPVRFRRSKRNNGKTQA